MYDKSFFAELAPELDPAMDQAKEMAPPSKGFRTVGDGTYKFVFGDFDTGESEKGPWIRFGFRVNEVVKGDSVYLNQFHDHFFSFRPRDKEVTADVMNRLTKGIMVDLGCAIPPTFAGIGEALQERLDRAYILGAVVTRPARQGERKGEVFTNLNIVKILPDIGGDGYVQAASTPEAPAEIDENMPSFKEVEAWPFEQVQAYAKDHLGIHLEGNGGTDVQVEAFKAIMAYYTQANYEPSVKGYITAIKALGHTIPGTEKKPAPRPALKAALHEALK